MFALTGFSKVVSCIFIDFLLRRNPWVSFALTGFSKVVSCIFIDFLLRRNPWVSSVNRKNWKPTKYTRICSAHFVGGSKSDDPVPPAYIPTLFQHVGSPTKRKAESQLASYNRRNAITKRRRLDAMHQENATMTLLKLSSNTEPGGNMNSTTCCDVQEDVDLCRDTCRH